MIIKTLALVFPVLLFVFKYILPSWAEQVYTDDKKEKAQIKVEIMHFPVDLLFVAIGYTVPQIIETTNRLLNWGTVTEEMVDKYNCLIKTALFYSIGSLIILLIVPFTVFMTKLIENNYYKKRKRWILQLIFCYIVASAIIIVSIFNV